MQRIERKIACVALLAATLIGGSPLLASGQTGAGAQTINWRDSQSDPIRAQNLTYVDQNGTAKSATTDCAEILRGTGSRAGYTLSHGGIVPGSVSVSVGVRTLKANVEYYLDYANGMLAFAEPVRQFDTIRVQYRYVSGMDASRALSGISGFTLNFAKTSLNLGYGISDGGNGLAFNTYGLGMNATVSKGMNLSGLMYFSDPSSSNGNLSQATGLSGAATSRKANASSAKSGTLIAQNLAYTSGKSKFRATYQDVGSSFNGFQSMRQNNAKNAEALAQIANLEKERGIKRLGFGAGLGLTKGGDLSLDWDQIQDASGDITKQAIAYTSKSLNMKFATQQVGSKFSAFKNLRETEAAQWAKEAGISRTDMSLGFQASKTSALSFTSNSFGDSTGKITRQRFDFTANQAALSFSSSKADSSFTRASAMSDAEKTAMALEIRRQYKPTATAAEVTQKDRDQLAASAGVSRNQVAFSTPVGKQSSMGFYSSSLSDTTGGVKRSGFTLATRGMSFSYLDQSISSGFTRVSSLSEFERSQLGNEVGLSRKSMALDLTLGKISKFAFSQLLIGGTGGGLSRQSFAFQTKGIDAKLNIGSTDSGFSRASDLAGMSDAEKAAISSERGFKRTDLTTNITAFKGMTLNTYTYSARNAAEQLGRDIYRYNVAWQASKTLKMNYLSEGNGSSQAGKTMTGIDHSLLTFENAFAKSRMRLTGYYDTLTTTTSGVRAPTTTTSFLHFESSALKAANLVSEMKRIDYGNGHFANTMQLDMNYKASKNLSLVFNHLGLDCGKDASSDMNSMQWTWQASKTMAISGTYALTTTNTNTDTAVRSLSISDTVAKNLNFKTTFAEVAVDHGNYNRQAGFSFSNAKPMNILGMKNATVTMSYAGASNAGKLQKESVGAKLQGNIGKNVLAFEYGGALDEKGNGNQARAFSFTSDRNEKLPFHFDISYKARSINGGSIQLVRKYNADLKLDKLTKLTYTYNTLPEGANNAIAQTGAEAFGLSRVLSKNMNFTLNYGKSFDTAKNTKVNKLAALLSGKTDKFSALQVGYSVDLSSVSGAATNAHTVSLGYSRNIDADHALGISTAYTMNGVAGVRDDVTTNVEFKTRF